MIEDQDTHFENQDADHAHEEETKRCLNQMQCDAGMQEDLPLDSPEPSFDDLGEVPDGDLLNELLNAQDGKGPEEPPPSPTKGTCPVPGMACNLHHALWTLGPNATSEEVFDSIFRLVMYLRHWQGGCDRTWIKDPRTSRRKGSRLNWHQCLARNRQKMLQISFTF